MSLESALLSAPVPSGRSESPTRERRERPLRPVVAPARRRRPKLAYALIALGGAVAIGAAQIALSLSITQDSFTLAQLNAEQRELDLQTRALEDQLAGLSSPQLLAANADALGMVVAGSASYLRLSDAAVLGANTAAGSASTVDPTGSGAVHNALLAENPLITGATTPTDDAEDAGDAPTTPDLPPPITDGLPSPTTR